MNDDERIEAMQYMIKKEIEEARKKHSTFIIYLPYGLIVADNYRFGEIVKDDMDLYMEGMYIATIKIWSIVEIG